MDKVDNLIIDGTNLTFRTYFVSRNDLKETVTGENIEIVSRFLYTFKKLVDKFNPTDTYITFDNRLIKGKTNYRKELLEGEYKAQREKPDDIKTLYKQELIIAKVLETLGVKIIYPGVLEADDVVGWLAHTLHGNSIIASSDHDMRQLVSQNVSIWDLKNVLTLDDFEHVVGIQNEHFILYKAIMGDKSDNINGLTGYGKVRSAKVAKDWENNTLTEAQVDVVERNVKLIDLEYGLTVEKNEERIYQLQLERCNKIGKDMKKFKFVCTEYDLFAILRNIQVWRSTFNKDNMANMINRLLDK